jgi:hypothetical protein
MVRFLRESHRNRRLGFLFVAVITRTKCSFPLQAWRGVGERSNESSAVDYKSDEHT